MHRSTRLGLGPSDSLALHTLIDIMIGKKIIKKVSKKDQNTKYTIWKFHDFSTTKILHKNNLCHFDQSISSEF